MKNKKMLFVTILLTGIIVARSFAQNEHKGHDHDMKPKNLKILPKDITGEELHKIMRGFSMSLGVHCGFCHVSHKVEGQERPDFDFASDDKPEKQNARNMMKMTMAINESYIGKMTIDGHAMEQITCVSCHNGHTSPMVSADSLMKKPMVPMHN